MAIYKDVVVNIQRLTSALAAPNYGLCLILTTESTAAYKEYSDLSAVAVDHDPSTKAYAMAAAIFAQEPKVDKVAIAGITFEEDFTDVTDGLSTILASNAGFMYLVSDVTDPLQMNQLATWATANKIFYVGVVTTSNYTTIENPKSDYVVYIVHDKKTVSGGAIPQYADAALVGACSTFKPGEATWMFKRLNGISPVVFEDQATAVEIINDKKYMTYVTKHGVDMTTGGFVTSGEYIDVMLGIVWIQAEMELRIQNMLVNTKKVPYDNSGIALIAAQVDATLREATANGIIRKNDGGVGEYEIMVPDISQIKPNDIAQRRLVDINWSAYLAGAIHHVQINGVVQY